jgi:5'-nucleotidase
MSRLALLILVFMPLASSADSLRILLTNDDGFEAPGIRAMHSALIKAGHDVYLIAPATQQSGAAASITSGGVRITAHEGNVWAVHGRPADAVRVGLGQVMKDNPPDLVVSGANFGNNTGVDTNISGTVGAAITALQLGYPAIAISVEIKLAERKRGFPGTLTAFPGSGIFLTRLISNLKTLDTVNIINVNYPAISEQDVKGVKWAELSNHSILTTNFNLQEDGRWEPELNTSPDSDPATDAALLANGYITLTLLDGNMSSKPGRAYRKLADVLEKPL